jgi:hypothetical protein
MLDDAAAALHAKSRIVQRGLVGGAADAEVERLGEGDRAAGVRSAAERKQIAGRHADVLERELSA